MEVRGREKRKGEGGMSKGVEERWRERRREGERERGREGGMGR